MQRQRLATWLGILLGTTFAVLLAGRAWASDTLTQEFHQTYALSADGRVELDNINGAVHITGWDRNDVQVDAVKRAHRQERLDEAKIIVNAHTNSISIRTEYPGHNNTFNWGDENNPASVEYTLHVPRKVRLDEIKLVNGELDIAQVSGEVHASSVNGRVEAHDLTGRTDISSVNGRTEVTFRQLPKSSTKISSVNGSLLVTIPSDANAEVHASTVNGGISSDFGLTARKSGMVGRNMDGRLGSGGSELDLSNVNGRIELRHAGDGKSLSPASNNSGAEDKDDDEGHGVL